MDATGRAAAVLRIDCHPRLGGAHRRTLAPGLESGARSRQDHPSVLRALVAPALSLRTPHLLKRLPGCLDPSARAHAAPIPHRRDAPA